MSVAHEHRVAAPEPGSDRAVVEAVRAGQVGQYALLYERYRAEALRIARRQVGPDEAQDLVQETFACVLRAVQNGGGPTEDVAGYIFRTLRNLRIDRGGQREFATEDVESAGPAGLWVVPDTSEEVLDRGLVADAFAELPPRWREVLWLTEVEGVGPSELSEKMGIKATAVSTLSLRARAGFRSAWLQAHVRAGSAPTECRSVVTKLGDYQTGRLSTRRRAQVQEHLDRCDHCPAVVAELVAVSDHMGVLLLPVVVLAPKALWWLFGGWGVKAGFLLWGTKSTLNRLREPKVAVGSVGGAATVAVVTAVAMAMTAPEPPPPAADPTPAASAPAPSPAVPSSPSSTSSAAPADSSDDADDPAQTPTPSDSPASVPVPPAAPTNQPSSPGTQAAEPQSAAPRPAGDDADHSAGDDAAGGDEAPASDATEGPEPEDPSPEPEEPAEPVASTPDPPEPSSSQSAGGAVYDDTLELTGNGAVPGATITARDDDGDVAATDEVADDGSWSVQIARPDAEPQGGPSAGGTVGPAGGSATMGIAARGLAQVFAERDDHDRDDADDSDDPDDGDDDDGSAEGHYFTLTQTVPEGVSEAYAGESEPYRVGPYTWVEPIRIVYPTEGESVRLGGCWSEGSDWRDWRDGGRDESMLTGTLVVGYDADTSHEVEFRLDGDPVEVHESRPWWCWPHGYGNDAEHVVWLPDVDEGEHTLSLQYLDDSGPIDETRVTVSFGANRHWRGDVVCGEVDRSGHGDGNDAPHGRGDECENRSEGRG